MRVAYVAAAPFISGAERSLQTTIVHVADAGIEPVVICPPASPLIDWCRANAMPVYTSPLPLRDKWHPLRWITGVRRMRALLTELRVDVVHSNQLWSYPVVGAAGLDLGIPRVLHIRDECSSAALAWFVRSGVEGVISISRHIGRQVELGWPATVRKPRIWTALNPVSLDPVLLDPVQMPTVQIETMPLQAAARESLGIDSDSVVFGFIGQIAPVKGLLELIGALDALPATRPWKLLIAGRDSHGGAYHRACVERVAALGLEQQVTFIGFLDDVAKFYHAIDVAVVPSLEEPMGRIPLEAGSYGKPAIAFAVGGLPEVVLDGITGWLVPPGDFAAFRAAMLTFIEHPSSTFGAAAMEFVVTTCDPRGYVKRLASIYQQLLEQHPAVHRRFAGL